MERSLPSLTGTDHTGKDVPTQTFRELIAMGRQWGWNILEAPVVWAMHATYICIAVIFGAGGRRSARLLLPRRLFTCPLRARPGRRVPC